MNILDVFDMLTLSCITSSCRVAKKQPKYIYMFRKTSPQSLLWDSSVKETSISIDIDLE